jgi:glycosyltransferase involved in cell wall biosynthesis
MSDPDGGDGLRVLHVAHALPPTLGGVETYLGRLLPALRSAGHAAAALSGGTPQPDDAVRGIRRTPTVDGHSLLGDGTGGAVGAVGEGTGSLADDLAQVVDDFRPDLLHVHNLHHFDAAFADAVATVRRRSGVPVVVGVHDRVGEAMDPAALARPWDLVVHASDHLHHALPTPSPSITLHLGVDTTCFHPQVAPDPELAALPRPLIVHPSRLLRWKGPHVSLAAFTKVRAAVPGATLVLPDVAPAVGDPTEVHALRRELGERAEEAGVTASVVFRSFPVTAMPGVLAAADVVWYPTTADEPFGLVPIEAMAAGVPVVASRSGGMVESVEHGRSGFLVARSDPAELADTTLRLLDDADLRRRIVAGGLARAERFSMARHVGELLAVYGSVLSKRTGPMR